MIHTRYKKPGERELLRPFNQCNMMLTQVGVGLDRLTPHPALTRHLPLKGKAIYLLFRVRVRAEKGLYVILTQGASLR